MTVFNREAKKDARATAAAERQEQIVEARANGEWQAGLYPKTIALTAQPVGKGWTAPLKFEEEGIVCGGAGQRKGAWIRIPWDSIEAIDIDGETTMRVTVTRALAVGVFALAAKKKSNHSCITIVTPDRDYGFEVKALELNVKNAFKPLLNALEGKAPGADDAPVSMTDEIAKLADLHAQGILSEEEFASAKTRLLG